MGKVCSVCNTTKLKSFKGNICNSCRCKYMRINRKLKALEYKGNKCSICGYDKCNNALEFHHLNPEEKDMQISAFICYSWETVQKELDKCILVCVNCHRELHAQNSRRKKVLKYYGIEENM